MKQIKKTGALVLALVLVLSLSVSALATTTLDDNGEQGVFTQKDTPVSQSKTLALEKEIKVFNLDEETIKAPTISYTYRIAPATVTDGTTVTDSDKTGTIHDTNITVTVPVKTGVGAPTIANNGVVAWAASEDVNAGTNGVKNVKDISVDFSDIVFTGPGVYRYAITEELTSGFTYATSGVTETTAPATGAHTRYIDVYVRPATAYSDGTKAADWDIYGFTCFYNNETITEANKASVPAKTTGFVDGSDGTESFLADQYYTFNVTISKTVENDGFGAATVGFPFTVLFTNETVSAGTIVTNGATAPTGTDFTHNTSVDLTTGDLKGIATLKHGQQIKYVGIPNGTSVEVYETNVATGVTYTASTSVDNGTATTDIAVVSGTTPTEAVSQATKANYQSTKATITTTANKDDDTAHSVAITNKLLTISPTGVVLRVAPFVMMLVAGVVILLVTRRYRRREEA